MKSFRNTYIKIIAIAVIALTFPGLGKAQIVDKTYFNIDWQFNIPASNSFADVASGWGMNFEGGYYIMPKFALGAFISYHTNNEYIPRQTIALNDHSALTTDQQHSIFQLPFGVATRYRFCSGHMVEPYVGLKLGATYSEMSSYYSVLKSYDRNWGVFVSPEVGMSIYPNPNKQFGFHVALYYSYASNKGDIITYSVKNLNNLGFRLGIAF